MEVDVVADRGTRPIRVYTEEPRASQSDATREEDKEDEGTVENMEIGLGTVVVA